MKIDNVYDLREAFWEEFLPRWNRKGRTLEQRYTLREKCWNEFKARMVAEGRITAHFAKNSLNP